MIAGFDRVMAVVSSVLALIAGALIAVILAVMVIDVTRRNVVGGSVAGAYEAITMMLVGVVFLGLAHAERTDTTIKLTLVTSRMPAPAAFVARCTASSLALVMCCWLCWATWGAAQRSIERGELQQGLLSLPTWPAKVVITLGFAVLAIEMVLSLRRTWLQARENRADAAGPQVLQHSSEVAAVPEEELAVAAKRTVR